MLEEEKTVTLPEKDLMDFITKHIKSSIGRTISITVDVLREEFDFDDDMMSTFLRVFEEESNKRDIE